MSITLQLNDYDTNDFIRRADRFGRDRYAYVVTPNVDHIIRYHDDAAFRGLYDDAGFILLDSQFLAVLLLLTKGMRVKTSPGSDVTRILLESIIQPDDNVVIIGGNADNIAKLAARYGLHGVQHYNPPMGFIHDAGAREECLRFIESASPFRFCLLAVGSPQQEIVAQALQQRGKARGLALCIGASIDFLTGLERRAPRWMQSIGMEWLFRLLQSPRRLASRYLVRGPRIFGLLPRMRFERRTTATVQQLIPRM